MEARSRAARWTWRTTSVPAARRDRRDARRQGPRPGAVSRACSGRRPDGGRARRRWPSACSGCCRDSAAPIRRRPPRAVATARAPAAAASLATPARESPSIAVLPFVNMSRDEENEYFADGLVGGAAERAGQDPRPARRVAHVGVLVQGQGRRHPDNRAASSTWRTVLEGSVRKSGKRVRITAQLIEVATDSHLWSETYDRELDDIFAVQDDIAQSVVKELRMALLGAPAERRREHGGRGRRAQGGDRTQRQRGGLPALPAGEVLRRARDAGGHRPGDRRCSSRRSRLDPDYALAWTGAVRGCTDAGGVRLRADRRGLRARARGSAAGAALGADLAGRRTSSSARCSRPRLGLDGGGRVVPARAGARARRRRRTACGARLARILGRTRRGARLIGKASRSTRFPRRSIARPRWSTSCRIGSRRGGVLQQAIDVSIRKAASRTPSWR